MLGPKKRLHQSSQQSFPLGIVGDTDREITEAGEVFHFLFQDGTILLRQHDLIRGVVRPFLRGFVQSLVILVEFFSKGFLDTPRQSPPSGGNRQPETQARKQVVAARSASEEQKPNESNRARSSRRK